MIINEMVNGFRKMPLIDVLDFGDGNKSIVHAERYFYIHSICTETNGYGAPYLYQQVDHNRDTKEDINSIYPSHKSLDLTNIKKVYFSKGCTIPRFKARDYFKDKGISIKLTPSAADVVFVGRGYITQKVVSDYYHIVEKYHLINHLQHPVAGVHDRLIEIISDYEGKYVICSGSITGSLNIYGGNYRSSVAMGSYLNTVSVEDYNFIQSWKTDTRIYPEEELLRVINCTVMDKDSYESLSTMLLSPDANNHVLAIELMSNCDYDTGFVYLSSLLMKFGSQINSSKAKKHVNFQSLIKYMGYRDFTYIRLDDIYENMKNRSMDEQERDRQMEILLEVGKELMPLNCKYFKVTGLEIIK